MAKLRIVLTQEEKRERRNAAVRKAYWKNKDNPNYHKNRQENKDKRRKYIDRRYAEQRYIIALYKSAVGCVDCGCNDPRVLDFDHIGEKSFNVAAMAGGNLRRVFEEIMKCEVRCSNCHRIKTWGRRNV